MHDAFEDPSMRSVTWFLAAAILLLPGCNRPAPGTVPDFVASLPQLGAESSRHDSAMASLARDLEAWATRVGQPASAEALIGPLFLHSSRFQHPPAASDTGVEADYQRLEVRFAELLATGDRLGHAADSAYEQVLAWAGREATPAADRTETLRRSVFPPVPDDPGRGTVMGMVKCALITVKVLASKEGVSICALKEKQCTRMPADDIGGAWWAVNCLYSCFDYIGWVPAGGGFTVGAK